MAEQRFQFVSPEAQRLRIGRTPEQQVRAASELRGGVLGGGATAPRPIRGGITQQANVDTSTLNAFRALSDAIIDPLIEQRQQEEYLEGARRQIEGEALKDIVDTQPWYSRIFGPSASVQGARTMAQMQAVEAFATEIERDMPQLRQLDPEAFGQELNNRIRQSADLGDSRTNVAVQAKLMESYGPIVRSHTKEHFAYVQQEMQAQFTGALATEARSLHSYMQGVQRGTVSEEDARIVLQNVEASLYPLDGQTPDSYWAAIGTATEEAMTQGNFHFVNLVQDRLYEHMPADQRIKFNNDRRKYEIQAAADMSAGPMALEIAQLKAYSAEGLLSPDGTWNKINQLNAQFRATTGIDRDLIDSDAATGIVTGNLRGIIQEQRAARERAADHQQRMAEIQQQAVLAGQLVFTGRGNTYIDQGGNRQVTQNAAWGAITQSRTLEQEGLQAPGTWAQMAVQAQTGDGFIIDALRNEIQGGVRQSIGSAVNPAFLSAYESYRSLRDAPEGGPGVAAAYAGDYADQLETYHQYVSAGTLDENQAFALTFNETPNRSPRSQETTKDIMEYLDSEASPGFFARTFGSATPLTDSAKRNVAAYVADRAANMENSTRGFTTEGLFNLAYPSVRNEFEIIGGHFARGSVGTRLESYVSVPKPDLDAAFNEVIDRRLRGSGESDLGPSEIIKMPDGRDSEGNPVPRYTVFGNDGMTNFYITGDEVRQVADEIISGGLRVNRQRRLETFPAMNVP